MVLVARRPTLVKVSKKQTLLESFEQGQRLGEDTARE